VRIHLDNVARFGTGPGTFANRLAGELFQRGHTMVNDGLQADISLVFIEPTGKPLAKKVVQRLDGIWFKPLEFHTKNVNIKALYQQADAVVWQSKFDRTMSLRHWGMPGEKRFLGCVLPEPVDTIIGNGIELKPVTEITMPGLASLRSQYEQIYVCSSNWHPQKRLKANIDLFEHLRPNHKSSCLIILGAGPDVRASGPHIYYAGSTDPDTYNQIYSIANWMLHLAWADHCPNVVVEALAQGTPVVCSEVGGTKELIGRYGVVLKDAPYNFELFDYDNPPSIDVKQVSSLPTRQELDYTSIQNIDIKHVADQYVRLFESLVRP
jgi:glycosyltransferase involved in cell wall biosynthesis